MQSTDDHDGRIYDGDPRPATRWDVGEHDEDDGVITVAPNEHELPWPGHMLVGRTAEQNYVLLRWYEGHLTEPDNHLSREVAPFLRPLVQELGTARCAELDARLVLKDAEIKQGMAEASVGILLVSHKPAEYALTFDAALDLVHKHQEAHAAGDRCYQCVALRPPREGARQDHYVLVHVEDLLQRVPLVRRDRLVSPGLGSHAALSAVRGHGPPARD
jgi:hypothetical protein